MKLKGLLITMGFFWSASVILIGILSHNLQLTLLFAGIIFIICFLEIIGILVFLNPEEIFPKKTDKFTHLKMIVEKETDRYYHVICTDMSHKNIRFKLKKNEIEDSKTFPKLTGKMIELNGFTFSFYNNQRHLYYHAQKVKLYHKWKL